MRRSSILLVALVLAGQSLSAQKATRDARRHPVARAVRTRAAKEPLTTGALATGSHDVVLNEVRFWYRVAGVATKERPPVLFLHGGPGYNSHSFSVLEGPRLERQLRMIYYDQRGAGRSERPWTMHYDIDTLVEDIEALRRTLGVPQIALIGHSFGGLLALEYAAKYPEQVSRLVLAGAFSDGPATCRIHRDRFAALHIAEYARVVADTAWMKAAARSDCELESRGLSSADFEAFNDSGIFPDTTRRRLQDSVDALSGLRNTGEQSRALVRAGLLFYRFTRHARLTMPTMVVIGGRDYAIGTEPQRHLAAAMPGDVTVVEYPRAGHFMYLDEPARFAQDVAAFLAGR